jgi:transposase
MLPANTMNNKTTSQAGRESVTGASIQTQKIAVIKLAVDVHAAKFKVNRQLGDLPHQPVQSFTPEGFLKFANAQLKLAHRVVCCYEAGPTGFWLQRQLSEMGIECYVVVPEVLDVYGRRVNNDRTDALNLGRKLSRFVVGEKDALAIVRVPTLEEEKRRATARQRRQFGKVLRSLAAMGRSQGLLHGYRIRGFWWRPRPWAQLQKQLPLWLLEHLDQFRPSMEEAEKKIMELTKELRQAAAAQALPFGFGALTFTEIEREICDWNRFKNRKQAGGYAGLCGGVSSTGPRHADLPITKHGNKRLRHTLIELAWRMVQYQPQCRAVQRWRNVLLNPKTHTRRRKQAIVALARQLMVDLWRWRTGRATAEVLGWKLTSAKMAA